MKYRKSVKSEVHVDIEIDNKTPLTMVDSVITWVDIHGEEAVSVVEYQYWWYIP